MIVKTKPLTNNQAEWLGLYSLLSDLPHNWNGIIYSDSLLVVNQWKGVYRIKNEQLKEIANTCRQLVIVKHLRFSLEWISREKNIFGKILERELRKRKRLNGKKKGKELLKTFKKFKKNSANCLKDHVTFFLLKEVLVSGLYVLLDTGLM